MVGETGALPVAYIAVKGIEHTLMTGIKYSLLDLDKILV